MEEELIKLIWKFNEHWETNKISEEYKNTIRREKYRTICNYLDKKQIIAITGLRRVGKTVIMNQIIDYLLNKQVDSKRIFYFSFDEAMVREHIIEDIIQYYENNIIKEDLKKTRERVYIFIDEIQYVEKWQAILKRYYDLHYKIKFIISGSSTIPLSKKAKESLAGRVYDFLINPLTFDEYLSFKKLKPSKPFKKIELCNLSFLQIKKIYLENIKLKDKISALFREYTLKGGFPENVEEDDLNKVQAYIINSVVEKIIYKDLPKTFKVRNPDLFLRMLQIISKYSSNLFSIENIADVLNVNRNVIAKYLFYLEKAFLIRLSYNYTESLLKQLRTMKKGYVSDVGIMNAMLKYDEEITAYPEIYGKIVETAVFNHCNNKHRVYFFRDKQKREIDIIIAEKEVMPVEVKYKSQITKADLKNILFFMQEKNLERGIIVTKDLLKEEKISNKSILLIPAWLFLLLD